MSGLTWHREELSRTEMVACWWQMGCNGFLLERWMDLCYHGKTRGYITDAEMNCREDRK